MFMIKTPARSTGPIDVALYRTGFDTVRSDIAWAVSEEGWQPPSDEGWWLLFEEPGVASPFARHWGVEPGTEPEFADARRVGEWRPLPAARPGEWATPEGWEWAPAVPAAQWEAGVSLIATASAVSAGPPALARPAVDLTHTGERWVEISPRGGVATARAWAVQLDEAAYDGPLRRLLAAGLSMQERGGVEWSVDPVDSGVADGVDGAVRWTDFQVTAASTCGAWSHRAWHFTGVVRLHEEVAFARVAFAGIGDGEAWVTGPSGNDPVRFVGHLVPALLAEGWRRHLAVTAGLALTRRSPRLDEIPPLPAWLGAVLARRPARDIPVREPQPSRASARQAEQAEQDALAAAWHAAPGGSVPFGPDHTVERWWRDGAWRYRRAPSTLAGENL